MNTNCPGIDLDNFFAAYDARVDFVSLPKADTGDGSTWKGRAVGDDKVQAVNAHEASCPTCLDGGNSDCPTWLKLVGKC